MTVSKKVKRMQRIYAESLNGVDNVVSKLRKTIRQLNVKLQHLESEIRNDRRIRDLQDENNALRRHCELIENKLVQASKRKECGSVLWGLGLFRNEPRQDVLPRHKQQQETEP